MKTYKVETLLMIPKISFKTSAVKEDIQNQIQEKLDEYARLGYQLISTDMSDVGGYIAINLYFQM